MKDTFTCIGCGKKFEDEVPDSVDKEKMFSMCLECGNKAMLDKNWEKFK